MSMVFKKGDYVTRSSHNNDILFKITSISNDIAELKGVNVRLCADSKLTDLVNATNVIISDEEVVSNKFDAATKSLCRHFSRKSA